MCLYTNTHRDTHTLIHKYNNNKIFLLKNQYIKYSFKEGMCSVGIERTGRRMILYLASARGSSSTSPGLKTGTMCYRPGSRTLCDPKD